jgi:2-haloacid dehalogenase
VTSGGELEAIGSDFDAVSFDCYGTLIDWERGILDAVSTLLGDARTSHVSDDEVLAAFGAFEPEEEAGLFRPYREVLRSVALRFGDRYAAPLDVDSADAFASSVGEWPPFADSEHALRRLGTGFRLAIVSNVDDDLFSASAQRLCIDFDEVVTAQQVRSYKPDPAHFHELLRRLGLTSDRVLHVAQSLYHDVGPAKALGFTCVWVNRRGGDGAGGATPPAVAKPDATVPDLATLARHLVPD